MATEKKIECTILNDEEVAVECLVKPTTNREYILQELLSIISRNNDAFARQILMRAINLERVIHKK